MCPNVQSRRRSHRVHVLQHLKNLVKGWPLVEIKLPAVEHELVEAVGNVRRLRKSEAANDASRNIFGGTDLGVWGAS
jgi:hypothetical protein